MTMTGDGAHALRMVMLAGGTVLTALGYLDAASWEAIGLAVLAVIGWGWSWLERQRLKAAPADAVGGLAAMLLRIRG
jgi:hypothetical protein